MFMEVPADLALTKFVLEVINSSVGENSDGVAEQVRVVRRAHAVVRILWFILRWMHGGVPSERQQMTSSLHREH